MDSSAWMALAGVGKGVVQNMQDREREKKQAYIRAAETAYSPWSGIKPSTEVKPAGALSGDVFQGGLQGWLQGQEMDQAARANELNQQIAQAYLSKMQGGNIWGGAAGQQVAVRPLPATRRSIGPNYNIG